ncbi:MAG: alpha/beta hydrolase [Novosphingobium sp.]|nr:alpha/beta hydrolase [Novosphingobium sp.]
MSNPIVRDPRIDPRIKALFAELPDGGARRVEERDLLIAAMRRYAESPRVPTFATILAKQDFEALASSSGLAITTRTVTSDPDGNTINLQVIRPEGTTGNLPCVYYIHGGGMAAMSCYDPSYSAWGRMIAHQGAVVVMVDFRNAAVPSSVPETAPYPAGLNDCLSGLAWVRDNTGELGIDASRVVVSGDSGGGNLALAMALKLKRIDGLEAIRGLYLLCPYLRGEWADAEGSSVRTNNGILIDMVNDNGPLAYGIEAFRQGDPLAWPGFATVADLEGLPPVKININECDPLVDDGTDLYRKLLEAGVSARCRIATGTIHATEPFVAPCPDISRDLARDIVAFARE